MNPNSLVTRLSLAILPPLVPLVLLTALGELSARQEWIAPYLLPAPSAVIRAIYDYWGQIGPRLLETVNASLAAFALSAVVGILLSIVLATGGIVQRAFYPYAVFFQTVPIVAIAPLLVIWFGFDMRAVIASGFIVSIFPVIASSLAGLLSVDPNLRDLFRLYQAGPLRTLFKLRLPYALPSIMTGLRIAAGLAVIGVIVGEFITGGGLGGLIQVARQQRKIELVFAALLVASLLGVILFGIVNLISWLLLRHWHASEQQDR